MKILRSKPTKIALLVAVPLALFLVARERASWRPQKVAGLPYDGEIAISQDGCFVANATRDAEGLISIRDLSTGEEVRHNAFRHVVSLMEFSPDGHELAMVWSEPMMTDSASHQWGAGVWNFKGKSRQFERLKEELLFDHATQIRYSPDGKTLWLASTDNLRSWDVASGRLKWQWRQEEMGHDSSLLYFSSLSRDCRFYCRSDGEGYSVWDTQSRKRLVHTRLPFLYDEGLFFSSDGLYATYRAETPKGSHSVVIDAIRDQVLWRSQQEPSFSGGKAICTLSGKTEFEVREVRTGKLLYRLPAIPGAHPINSTSSDWLYSIGRSGELFRQRLR